MQSFPPQTEGQFSNQSAPNPFAQQTGIFQSNPQTTTNLSQPSGPPNTTSQNLFSSSQPLQRIPQNYSQQSFLNQQTGTSQGPQQSQETVQSSGFYSSVPNRRNVFYNETRRDQPQARGFSRSRQNQPNFAPVTQSSFGGNSQSFLPQIKPRLFHSNSQTVRRYSLYITIQTDEEKADFLIKINNTDCIKVCSKVLIDSSEYFQREINSLEQRDSIELNFKFPYFLPDFFMWLHYKDPEILLEKIQTYSDFFQIYTLSKFFQLKTHLKIKQILLTATIQNQNPTFTQTRFWHRDYLDFDFVKLFLNKFSFSLFGNMNQLKLRAILEWVGQRESQDTEQFEQILRSEIDQVHKELKNPSYIPKNLNLILQLGVQFPRTVDVLNLTTISQSFNIFIPTSSPGLFN